MARQAGLVIEHDSRRGTLESLADALHPTVTAFEAGLEVNLHFVTHSKGGLLARLYLSRNRPSRLGRIVMLGPPNHGSPVADLLHRTLAYRAPFDRPASSSRAGAPRCCVLQA